MNPFLRYLADKNSAHRQTHADDHKTFGLRRAGNKTKMSANYYGFRPTAYSCARHFVTLSEAVGGFDWSKSCHVTCSINNSDVGYYFYFTDIGGERYRAAKIMSVVYNIGARLCCVPPHVDGTVNENATIRNVLSSEVWMSKISVRQRAAIAS